MKRVLFLIPAFLLLILFRPYINPSSSQIDSSPSPSEGTTGEMPRKIPVTSRLIEDVVKRGETMFDIFHKYGLDIQELLRLREASAGIHRLRNISAGKPYKIELAPDNSVRSLIYQIDDDLLLTITRTDPGFRAEKVAIPYETRESTYGGRIESNLYDCLGNDGESGPLAYALADIFSWDIDFTTDLRKGDTFRIVVEELWLNGRFMRYGNILAAEFVNDGKTSRAFRYEGPDGRAAYYDEEGKSLQRSFLKAPLSYRRISSGFTFRRMHPILKIRQPHLGVDYVAPRGTPVSALGDGTVLFAGYKGANGNLVILRHPKGFTTYYGHLAKIRKGIRRGARVAQGDVVGYVGATGRATGPHLDFRMKHASRFVNPLKVDIPRGGGIPKQLLADHEKKQYALGLLLASIVPAPPEPGTRTAERTVASGR
jgi:murein DD-endopeptidase MepM/ murein hydrolase activator NlpD